MTGRLAITDIVYGSVSARCNCQSGSWTQLSKVSRYASIDLSAAQDKGPDGLCTFVLNTRYLEHTFELDSNSLLLLNGYMGSADVAGNVGGLCLFVNGKLCNAESVEQFRSASASCIVPVAAGTVSIRIVGAHRYGLHAFRAGYAALPM